ncbi:hypothetical protein BGX31_005966 [Mortierella sp. GBA43]|nr:hypothetical protein BGX31_005966 [Mortierella sp. GBA43]
MEDTQKSRFKFQLNQEDDVVITLSQPDTRYYGAFTTEFINTLAFHVLKAGGYTVIPHVEREPTDVMPETGETRADNAVSPTTRKDDVQVMVESVQMNKSSYMFKQCKAGLVRSMSMARITSRTLLGIDEEDYENGGQPKSLEEEQWQLMLGLRVYSRDHNITGSRGVPTQSFTITSRNLDSHEEEGPARLATTCTLMERMALRG